MSMKKWCLEALQEYRVHGFRNAFLGMELPLGERGGIRVCKTYLIMALKEMS